MRMKLFCYFVLLCIPEALFSIDIEFKAEAVENAIQKCIVSEKQISVVNFYQNEMNQTSGSISAKSVADICNTSLNSECDCKEFVSIASGMLENTNLTFKEVCKNTTPNSKEICVKNFFVIDTLVSQDANSLNVNVNRMQGEMLAKEYALIRNKRDITCFSGTTFKEHDYPLHIDALGVYHSNSMEKMPGVDDYLLCSNSKGYLYEFKFDDLNETNELDRELSVKKAVCKIHNVPYLEKNNDVVCNTSDKTICDNLNDSFEKFGYYSIIENGVCSVKRGMKTALGINNRALYYNSSYERLWNPGIKDDIWTTVVDAIGVDKLKTFVCEDNLKKINYLDENSKLKTEYYLRCKINSEIIDFVFLNNFNFNDSNKVSNASKNAFKAGVGFACFIEGDPVESGRKAHLQKGDPGGWTLCGLAQNSHKSLNIQNMTIQQVVDYHYQERFVNWKLYQTPNWISPLLLELSFGGLGTFFNQLSMVLFEKTGSLKINDNIISEIKKYEKLGKQSDLYEALVKKRFNSYGNVSNYMKRSCKRMLMKEYFFNLANLFLDVMYVYSIPKQTEYRNMLSSCDNITTKDLFNKKFE